MMSEVQRPVYDSILMRHNQNRIQNVSNMFVSTVALVLKLFKFSFKPEQPGLFSSICLENVSPRGVPAWGGEGWECSLRVSQQTQPLVAPKIKPAK